MSVRLVFAAKLPIDAERRTANIEASRSWPLFQPVEGTTGPVAICAAGPSLLTQIDALKAFQDAGIPICAIKGTDRVLFDHGIKPKYSIYLDAKKDQVRFLGRPIDGVEYLVASQSDPEVFEALRGQDVKVWHASSPACHKKGDRIVTGGCTVGLRTINLMRWAGYTKLHLFGYDCVLGDNGTSHVYAPPKGHGKPFLCRVGTKEFMTTPELAAQHEQFIEQCIACKDRPDITVHGEGSLTEVYRFLAEKKQVMVAMNGTAGMAVYDEMLRKELSKVYMVVDKTDNMAEIKPDQINEFRANPVKFMPVEVQVESNSMRALA